MGIELDKRFVPFNGLDCDIENMITGNAGFSDVYLFRAFDGYEDYLFPKFTGTSDCWIWGDDLEVGKVYMLIVERDTEYAYLVDMSYVEKAVNGGIEFTYSALHEMEDAV